MFLDAVGIDTVARSSNGSLARGPLQQRRQRQRLRKLLIDTVVKLYMHAHNSWPCVPNAPNLISADARQKTGLINLGS